MHKGKKTSIPPSEKHAADNGKNGSVRQAEIATATAHQYHLRVLFADSFASDILYAKIGVDPATIDLSSLKLLPGSAGVLFQDKEAEPFAIDGATLRYLADPSYARSVDQRIEAARLPADRLDRLIEKSEPPPEWFNAPQSKLF